MNVSARLGNRRLAMRRARAGVGLNLRQSLVLLIMVVTAALFYAFTTVRAYEVRLMTSRAAETQRELLETGRRLRVELGSLRAPQRLEREGRKLGLAEPAPEQMRVLE